MTDIQWKTSSFSGGDGCVGVALLPSGDVAITHSKQPDAPVIVFSLDMWERFCENATLDTEHEVFAQLTLRVSP